MWLTALKSCWFQRYRIMRSYLFNTLSGFLTFYIVFSLMFFGIKGITDVLDLGNTLEGVFAGYIVWVLAMMGSTDLA